METIFFVGEDGRSSHYLVLFGPFPPFILPSFPSPFFPSTLLSLLLSPISSYLFSLLQFLCSLPSPFLRPLFCPFQILPFPFPSPLTPSLSPSRPASRGTFN